MAIYPLKTPVKNEIGGRPQSDLMAELRWDLRRHVDGRLSVIPVLKILPSPAQWHIGSLVGWSPTRFEPTLYDIPHQVYIDAGRLWICTNARELVLECVWQLVWGATAVHPRDVEDHFDKSGW